MLFKPGDHITSIRLDGYNYAIPILPSSVVNDIGDSMTKLGLSFRVHSLDDVVFELVHKSKELEEMMKVVRFPIDDILITSNNYVSRESKALLEHLGVRAFITESPKLFKEMYLIMDEANGNIFATTNLTPGYQLIDQVEGYFTSNNLFSCELGEYQILKEAS